MSQHVEIKISAIGDPPLFPELGEKVLTEGLLTHVGILEGGMQSGGTSVTFHVTLPDDKIVLVQLSAGMLNCINSATQGAVARFGK